MTDILLDQPAGIGDVLFVQKICSILARENRVYYPIDQACWDNGVCQVVSDAIMLPRSRIEIQPHFTTVNLSDQPKKNGYIDTMTSKYDGLGIDWRDWSSYLKYNRVKDRERNLFEHYGIKDNEPYTVLNPFFNSKPETMSIGSKIMQEVQEGYKGKVIVIDPHLEGTTVFDYCSILENAEEIHTVDTCFQYIVETLEVKATRLVVYPRHPNRSELTVGKLFSKPWEWS
jgi:hypothetical protein